MYARRDAANTPQPIRGPRSLMDKFMRNVKRRAAVYAFGKSGKAVAIVQRLEDTNPIVRGRAVDALQKSPKVVVRRGAAIVQLLEHTDRRVRVRALHALQCSPEAVVQHLVAILQCLKDTDAHVRMAALHVLGSGEEKPKPRSLFGERTPLSEKLQRKGITAEGDHC